MLNSGKEEKLGYSLEMQSKFTVEDAATDIQPSALILCTPLG